MAHAARQRHRAVVRQHVAVQGIERRIVDVGGEDALLQVVQHHHPRDAAQPAESFLMQFRPDLGAGTEHQQPHRFTAVAQGQHKQASPAILAAAGVAHDGPRSIIHLGLFARGSLDHRAGFRRRLATQTRRKRLTL